MATRTVSGSFTSTTQSATLSVERGRFNLSLSGTWVASINIERSFDAGSTWLVVATYTANVEDMGIEPQTNVSYRLNCTFTSGTVVYRLSQDAAAAWY